MSAIIILICVSLGVALFFLFAFYWALKEGQYEDDVSPSVRIIIDDDLNNSQKEIRKENVPVSDFSKIEIKKG